MARDFDDSNPDYIDFGNPSHLDISGDQITVSVWVKLPVSNGEYKIVAKWSDSAGAFSYLVSTIFNDVPQFVINNSESAAQAIGTTELVGPGWHHICGTYDGSTVRVYTDGVEEGSVSRSGNIDSTTAPLRLGVGSGATSEQPHDGCIGHVAIWDRALSASEAASLSEGISPLALDRTGLVFYAPLNGQSPEPDIVGGASGTVTGTTVVEEPPIPNSIVAP